MRPNSSSEMVQEILDEEFEPLGVAVDGGEEFGRDSGLAMAPSRRVSA